MGCPQSKSRSKDLVTPEENGTARQKKRSKRQDGSTKKQTTTVSPPPEQTVSKNSTDTTAGQVTVTLNGSSKAEPSLPEADNSMVRKVDDVENLGDGVVDVEHNDSVKLSPATGDTEQDSKQVKADTNLVVVEFPEQGESGTTKTNGTQMAETEVKGTDSYHQNQSVDSGNGQSSARDNKIELNGQNVKESDMKNEINTSNGTKDENKANGTPATLPAPAPPKSKKRELITPATFLRVDKMVSSTPDKAQTTLPKLGKYLSGTLKDTGDDAEPTDHGLHKNLPPAKPPTTKKKDLFKDVSVFKHIDDHASQAPESVQYSVEKLAEYLCSPATNDLEKVRAFYFWICNNISLDQDWERNVDNINELQLKYLYDMSNPIPDRLKHDAAATLRQKQGSFVSLMSALCRVASIPAVTILGCSKGLRHQPDKMFSVAERNHCWNAVYINKEWHLLDCTWGAGYLDANNRFQRHFDEFWFCTDPDIFVYDHFPTHYIWQLLENPIDIEEFNMKPSLTQKSKEFGLELVSHREPIINFQGEVTIEVATETIPMSNITTDLRNDDGEEVNKYRCMRRVNVSTFDIRVVPPNPGTYHLLIYGKAKDYKHAKFRKLMEYSLICDSVGLEEIVFPPHLKAWGPEPNFAELGFADSIQEMSVFKTTSNEMVLTLEQTRNLIVSPELKTGIDTQEELPDYIMVNAGPLKKHIHVRFPKPGYYKLDIFSEGKVEGTLEFAASFLLECQTDGLKPEIFPKYNPEAVSKFQASLIEPKSRKLPAEEFVTFKVEAASLKKLMLGIPLEEDQGARIKGLGDLECSKQASVSVFEGQFKTPKKGEILFLSGCAAPPNIFWTRLYEFVIV